MLNAIGPAGASPGWTGANLFAPTMNPPANPLPADKPPNPRNSPQTQVVALPGYGTQCAIIGSQTDPATGRKKNLIVSYGAGLQRTFATEQEYLAFCGGGGGGYPGVPQAYAPAPQVNYAPAQPQNINISIPAAQQTDPNFMNFWLAQQASRDADRDALLTALTARSSQPPASSVVSPIAYPSYAYTPSSDPGSVPQEVMPQQVVQTATPESGGTPTWVWLALGGLAILAFSKGKKK